MPKAWFVALAALSKSATPVSYTHLDVYKRQPIGLILSYAEFVIDEAGDGLTGEHRDFLRTIHGAAERMRRVVDDFLDVSLIEAGRFSLDEQPVELGELARSAITLVNLAAVKRRVHIITDLDASAGAMQVDGAKIEQVLTNLLSNAVEHLSLIHIYK